MPQFPQGAHIGTTLRVCDDGACVLVVRDNIKGDVLCYPQRCCSEGNRGLVLGLFCACKGGWRCGAHSEATTGGCDICPQLCCFKFIPCSNFYLKCSFNSS